MFICALGALVLSTAALAEVLIDTDFGPAGQPVNLTTPDGQTDVTGALPAEWNENSTGSWQPDIAIRYRPLAENGRRFLRFEKLRGGNLQLAHSLPAIKEQTFLRLTFTARSVGGGAPEFGIRFDGAPYSFPWQVSPNLTPEWREVTYNIRLEPQPQSVRLQISHGGVGEFDLQRLRLERFTREELIAAVKAETPQAAQGNLARITRFPLGLPSGWFLDRDDDDATVRTESDPKTLGPSGAPALRVTAPGAFRLNSAPFAVPWSFEKHTVSLSLRGQGQGRLVVIADGGRQLAAQPFRLTGEWQRVSVTFQPVLRGEVHGLRIEGEREVYLDALQVERGEAATAYRPVRPCEVVLALPASEAAVARVQFEDEPARVAYAVTGDPAAVLRAKVANLYGESRDLPPVRLGRDPVRQGVIDYTAAALPKYGAFRIEAWVEDAAGKPLSDPYEVVINRLRRPRYWGKEAPQSPFGVHTQPATRHLMMAKAMGINWVRLHDAGMQYLGWSWLEPEKGKWTFFDDEIHRYRRWNLSILGQLETAPNWATGYPQPCRGYWDRWYQPTNLDDWAEYVRTVVARYRNDIHAYEVWNEPWGGFWAKYDAAAKDERTRSATAAADYAALQASAYRAAKAVDPGVTIVGFNSYGGFNGKEWTAGVLENGGYDTCDVFSYHKYTSAQLGYPGDDVSGDGLAHADAPIVAQRGKLGKPAWMSEGTILRYSTWDGLYRYTLPYPNGDDTLTAADNTARYVISTLGGGAEKLFLYTMHGIGYYYGSGQPDWRCLVTNDGYLHPASVAHSALAWLLEDTKFAKVVEVRPGVFAYLFEGAGRAVAAICPKQGHAAFELPPGLAALDLFGNPARERRVGTQVTYVTGKSAGELEKALGRQ